jgi:hypothetical protein
MAKKKRKPHPALDVYINATSFRMAANELAELAENDSMYIWPVMVNEALCLELYLKCMHRLRRRYGRTHDIKELFATLSRADQKKIMTNFQQIMAEPEVVRQMPDDVDVSFESVLQRSRDIFVKGRYWHEGELPSRDTYGDASNAGVGVLIAAVRELIFQLQPDWENKRGQFIFGGKPRKS